jgi:hypothetical protein
MRREVLMPRILFAVFLLAHAAIHASYISPPPAATAGGPAWPFELGRSWLLSPLGLSADMTRIVGIGLVALLVIGFGIAALATLGVVPMTLWPGAVVVGAVASTALLVLFFHPWLVAGVGIDLALLWAALVVDWTPASLGG